VLRVCAGPDLRQLQVMTLTLAGVQLDSFLPGSSFPVVFAAQKPRRAPSRKAAMVAGLRLSVQVCGSFPPLCRPEGPMQHT